MTKWVVSEDAAAPAALAAVAQLVERVLGKDEVTGPNPVSSSWLPEVRRTTGNLDFWHSRQVDK